MEDFFQEKNKKYKKAERKSAMNISPDEKNRRQNINKFEIFFGFFQNIESEYCKEKGKKFSP